jgi:hypothetical protein
MTPAWPLKRHPHDAAGLLTIAQFQALRRLVGQSDWYRPASGPLGSSMTALVRRDFAELRLIAGVRKNHPPVTVYRITPAGRAWYDACLGWLDGQPPAFRRRVLGEEPAAV